MRMNFDRKSKAWERYARIMGRGATTSEGKALFDHITIGGPEYPKPKMLTAVGKKKNGHIIWKKIPVKVSKQLRRLLRSA